MIVKPLSQVELDARSALAAGRLQEAETLARRAVAQASCSVQTWIVLVAALRRQGRHAEALPLLEQLVAAVPQNYEMHFDLAEMHLLLGNFARGWREYRFRYQMQHTRTLNRIVQAPLWEGQPIAGKTLLIHDEQGYGDTFQFLRMVAWARQRCEARIILQISAEQKSFAERMQVADVIILRGELPPPFDYHCRMMDLPLAMGLKLEDLPGTPMPYLSADAARVTHWRKRLKDLPRPLIALNWAGRPEHVNDANRSISLAQYAPLVRCGASFLSIQKGPGAAQAANPPAGMRLYDLSAEIADFEDTAAVLMVADLLISIDSSPVHLAGALGRPAWVLLPFFPDWRWLLGCSDTPWYPSLKLFRQPVVGDWGSVLQRVERVLADV